MNDALTVAFQVGEQVSFIYDLLKYWTERFMKGPTPHVKCGHGKFFIASIRQAIGVERKLHPQVVRIIYRPPGQDALTTTEVSGVWLERTGRRVPIFERNDIVKLRIFKGSSDESRAYVGEECLADQYGPSTFRVERVEWIITSAPGFSHPQWVTLDRHDCVGHWRRQCPQGIPRISGFFLEKHNPS